MTNREVLNAILERYRVGTRAQRDLVGECEHQRTVETEDGPAHPDLASALEDAYRFAVDADDKQAVRAAREALIEAGHYRAMTDDEIADTVTTRGPVWSFRLKGKPFTYDASFTEWLAAPAQT